MHWFVHPKITKNWPANSKFTYVYVGYKIEVMTPHYLSNVC